MFSQALRRTAAWLSLVLMTAALAGGLFTLHTSQAAAAGEYDAVLYFPFNKYPYTGDHIRDAIAAGHPDVCTIDRDGADENRAESLQGIPTKTGYDRDEWPMAMCEEGGAGADVRYVPYSDNRGSGSWVGNQLSVYPDGTRIKFIMSYN
ncbi:sporulation protein [Paenibacillus mucilaginosus K02]|nr:sporulation protein [Paenibacillus mucilaginosus K02]